MTKAQAPVGPRHATPTVLDEEIVRLLHQLMRRVHERFESQVAELDLTGPQAALLRHLDTSLPMHEVAYRLHCDASNVTGVVDRLEARGLVERRTLPSDRRVKQLVLTEEGMRVRRRIEALTCPVPGVSSLSEAERMTLRDLLRRALSEQADGEPAAAPRD